MMLIARIAGLSLLASGLVAALGLTVLSAFTGPGVPSSEFVIPGLVLACVGGIIGAIAGTAREIVAVRSAPQPQTTGLSTATKRRTLRVAAAFVFCFLCVVVVWFKTRSSASVETFAREGAAKIDPADEPPPPQLTDAPPSQFGGERRNATDRQPEPASTSTMPDISGRWRYTQYSEPGELLDGEVQIRRTEGEPSVLSAQRVPAFEPPPPAFLLKWRPDLRKFEIVPADPQIAKAAQELRLETFQVSADRQSIRQAVTWTEKGLEDSRKLTDQQIADSYNFDGIVLTRLGAIEPEPNSTKPIAKVAETQSGRSMFGVGVALPDTPAAKQLVEQLGAQESAAAVQAATIRQLQASGLQFKTEIAGHQRELKNLLSTAFDLKLQLEELQVKELQSRLSSLERQIGQRKQLREKIIARRAGELIEGDALRWDSTAPASTKLPGSVVGNTKKPATPEVVAILRERLALLWDDLRNGNAKPEAGLRAINELAQAEPPEAHAQHVERLQSLLELVRGSNAVSKAEVLEIEAAYEAARSADDKRVKARPGELSSSPTAAPPPKADQIVIDLYGGSQVLPGLGKNPGYSKLIQSLNALKGVTTNFREIQTGDATTVVMAIVRDPSQRCQREARQTQKESELRIAINSALKAAGIEATRWDENLDAEEKSADEPVTSKTSRGQE